MMRKLLFSLVFLVLPVQAMAQGGLSGRDFQAACEKWSKANKGKTWFETKYDDGTGLFLVEKGQDGVWRYTRIDVDKKDGRATPIKDLSSKAGIEETSDRELSRPNLDAGVPGGGNRKPDDGGKQGDPKAPEAEAGRKAGGPLANGIVAAGVSDKPTYVLNGQSVTKDAVKNKLENESKKINDISTKPWVVAVGTPEQQERARREITPMQMAEVNFKGMTPAEVKEKGLNYVSDPDDVRITVTDPSGKVLHAQTGPEGFRDVLANGQVINDRRYNPRNDPDLRDSDCFFPFGKIRNPTGLPTWLLAAGAGGLAVWFYQKNNKPKDPNAPAPK